MNTILSIDFPIRWSLRIVLWKVHQRRDFFLFCALLCDQYSQNKLTKTSRKPFHNQEKKETRTQAKGRSEERENGIGERSLCSSAPLLWNICWIIIRALGTQLFLPNIDFSFLGSFFFCLKKKTAPRSSWFSESQLNKCYYYYPCSHMFSFCEVVAAAAAAGRIFEIEEVMVPWWISC